MKEIAATYWYCMDIRAKFYESYKSRFDFGWLNVRNYRELTGRMNFAFVFYMNLFKYMKTFFYFRMKLLRVEDDCLRE